jgi:hypothetical protein
MKKTELRTMIRNIVREEVAMAINEVITELKQPIQQVSKPKPKVVEGKEPYKKYSKNAVLNDILNETAQGEEWKTLGDEKFTTDRMGDIMNKSYGDMMTSKPSADQMIISSGGDPNSANDTIKNVLNRDYSGVVKAMAKNSQQKGNR